MFSQRFMLAVCVVWMVGAEAPAAIRASIAPLFPGAQYATGHSPYSVAIGDLDGDQVLDLAVANWGSDNVSVLLGVGDGTFAAAVYFAAGNNPCSVAVGDLDGDQVPDLAVANRGPYAVYDGTVSVLLGLGDGTFAAAVDYAAGVWSQSVAIGDLDGDQVPDLAVANRYSDNVSVLLGLGDGTFAVAVDYPAGDYPNSVAIGDLDGDHVPDLAVANGRGYGNVSVLLGLGDGTFAAAVNYAVGSFPSSVAIGDLNGDQVPDLTVANRVSDNVSVLLGVGDGTFAAAVNYPAGDGPQSVAIGDLDGDQVPDLAVANAGSGDNVSVLLGVGDGKFAAAVYYAAGSWSNSMAIGDLDGDQVPDLAVADVNSDNISVLLGVGDGKFAAVPYSAGGRPNSVAIGDLDGDQVPDLAVANGATLAVANGGRYLDYEGTVSILLGLGDGTFAAAVHYAAGSRPHSVAIGDLDGDQVLDLAVANGGRYPAHEGTVSVLVGLGDGTFATAVNYTVGSRPHSVAIGDLDGDQVPDLAVANGGTDPAYEGTVSVLLGLGEGTFVTAEHYAVGNYPTSVAIGDLDGDHVPDLAVANAGSDNVSMLLGVGDGTFAATVNYAAGRSPYSVAIGDLDGDRVPDLAVANAGSGDNISVLLGVGDGTFAAAVNYAAGRAPWSVAIGDLDGDQVPDLAVANRYSHNVSVLLGVGDGTFAAAVYFAAGNNPCSVAIGDLDGDQAPDLAVANRRSNSVLVLLNQTSTIPVGLDIKPGSCPNPLNMSSQGYLPVAVVGTEDFDVMTIDVTSVRLLRADGVGGEVAPNEGPPGPHSVFDDVATPFEGEACDCNDFEGDDIDDLSMKFKRQELVEILELGGLNHGDEVELVITGLLADGEAFTTRTDCILIVPMGTSTVQVESTAPSTFVGITPNDINGSASAYADFQRTYDPGTALTLIAPTQADDRSFYAWRVNGVMQAAGLTTLQTTVIGGITAEAVYTDTRTYSPRARPAARIQRRQLPGP